MLVYVEVMALAPDPDADLEWQIADRRRGLERLASVTRGVTSTLELLVVQAGSAAAGLQEAARCHGDPPSIGASRRDEFERVYIGEDTRAVPEGLALRRRSRAGRIREGAARREQDRRRIRRLAPSDHALSVVGARTRARRRAVGVPGRPRPDVPEDGVREARERIAALGTSRPTRRSATDGGTSRYSGSVDLLVLGSHKHRPSDLLPGGTTSQRLSDSVQCPLLVLSSASGAA